MTILWVVWFVAAVAILVVGLVAGQGATGTPLGLLIDERGRYSLNRFQLLWWLWIILSMIAGVAAARFSVPDARPLGFTIPGPVLALLGTVGATTVASSTVKAYRDSRKPSLIAASLPGQESLGQLLLQEEGADADQTLDVGKFQALVITLLLGLGYVLTAIYVFMGRDNPPINGPGQITQLPELDPTFVALLAVSSSSYVATKLISRSGEPPASLTDRDKKARAELKKAREKGGHVDGRKLRQLLRESMTEGNSDDDDASTAAPKSSDQPATTSTQVGGIPLKSDELSTAAQAQDGHVNAGRGVPLDGANSK